MVSAATSAVDASAFGVVALDVVIACAAFSVHVPPADRAACDAATNVVDTTAFVAVPVRVLVLAAGAAFDAATNVADTTVFVVSFVVSFVVLVPSLAGAAGIRAEAAYGVASACTGPRTGKGREKVEASAGPRCRTRCRRRSSRTTRPACSPSPC